MDGLKVAFKSWATAHKFLLWALVESALRWWVELLHVVNWHREVSRELLVLKPRRPTDLYDNGYALFAYDIGSDAWVGHWRAPNAVPGLPAAETYAWREQWNGIPYHEVEFSDMPEVTFKVRAVQLSWCREHLKPGEGAEMLAAVRAQVERVAKDAADRQEAQALQAQSESTGVTKH